MPVATFIFQDETRRRNFQDYKKINGMFLIHMCQELMYDGWENSKKSKRAKRKVIWNNRLLNYLVVKTFLKSIFLIKMITIFFDFKFGYVLFLRIIKHYRNLS